MQFILGVSITLNVIMFLTIFIYYKKIINNPIGKLNKLTKDLENGNLWKL